jgi:biopolymer transport protein ExbD
MLDDGRYWGDVEGHIISVANFASSVIDVPFESSDKNAFLEFVADAEAVPKKGTPVQVVMRPATGAEKAPARITVSVDALGRIELDGAAVPADELPAAVKRMLGRREEVHADVKLDPRALVYDRDRVHALLEEAGAASVRFQTRSLHQEVLPRTATEAGRSLAWWRRQFAEAKDLIIDPAEDAAATLRHVEHRRRQLEALSELWADYAARLEELLKAYRSGQQGAESGRP